MDWLNSLLMTIPFLLIGHTRDWLENTPADHTKFKAQPGASRELKVDISDRLKNLFYGFTAGETTEAVKKLAYYAQGTAPSSMANAILSFGSDVAGKCEKFYLTEDGTFIQATKIGKLHLAGAIASGTHGDIFFINTTGDAARLAPSTSGLPLITKGAAADPVFEAMAAAGLATDAVETDKIKDKNVTAPKVADVIGPWNLDDDEQVGGGGDPMVKDTIYRAELDGFVVVNLVSTGDGSVTRIYCDDFTAPTTLRMTGGSTSYGHQGGICIPVAKNDYWKVTCAKGTVAISWRSLGS